MTRDNLLAIADKFKLFPERRALMSPTQLVELMKKASRSSRSFSRWPSRTEVCRKIQRSFLLSDFSTAIHRTLLGLQTNW